MQRVLCVYVRDEKSWIIESNDVKNIYFLIRKVLKHWTKWNKKSIFNLFLSLTWHLKIFQFSLHRMRHLAKSHAFSYEFSAFMYIYWFDCCILTANYLHLSKNSRYRLQNQKSRYHISMALYIIFFYGQAIFGTIRIHVAILM